MSGSLQLALTCLTYDFIGTSNDETSDDLSTVHMPTNWRKGKSSLTVHMPTNWRKGKSSTTTNQRKGKSFLTTVHMPTK